MSWALWVSFAAISAVNIVTPGPANLNTVRRAMQLGMAQIAPTTFGNALGLAVGGVVCAAGITSFVMTSGLLWSLFQWVGVAYLAWLGVKLLIKKETLSLHSQTDSTVPARALFFEAFLLAATNPKALLFYMALFPQILGPGAGIGVTSEHSHPDLLRPIHPVAHHLFDACAYFQEPFHDAGAI